MPMRAWLFLCGLTAAACAAEEPAFTPLLDAKLSQWEKWLGVPHRAYEVPGYVRGATAKEDPVLGLNRDPLGVFSAQLVDGEPVLRITGQVFGGLTSLQSFDNFHLRTQQRWGQRKWEPRLNAVRDNGILIYCVGEHGAGGKNWMRSQECQVQEGDIGDWWPIAGTLVDVTARDEGKTVVFDPKAPLRPMKTRIWHGTDYQEKPSGEWNTIEVYSLNGNAVFRLNGRTVNVVLNSRYREKGSDQEIPLKAGKLQIQSEAAECEYRRFEIRPLKDWPKEVAGDVPVAAPAAK
ncbi:MAG: N-acetylneuraminate epimerase [Verrucomicrobiota bacterium]